MRGLIREYPVLCARVKREGADLYFLDETGVRTTDLGGRTWGERGQRPVVSRTEQNVGVNVIGALSPRKIYLVLDRHPVHTSRKVEQKVKSLQGKVELVFLPGYAPEVNPEEGVWILMKPDVRRKDVGSHGELKVAVLETLRSLAKLPGYPLHIFHNPQFAYVLNSS